MGTYTLQEEMLAHHNKINELINMVNELLNRNQQLEEEINKLKSSIERREKLLSNENYVNKAPANIVEMDRKKLAEEQKKLAELLK